ncbi:hypothetical protein TRSC58_04020 [Trypanosoma rangeli SC58]|uniref:Uncharacterized protein n=1 Tax=Trypanosoma rangeli SC58 TaxID=429131 RepID=A0A061IZZ6_TRYRA|nr:hypothetical protein TRSC58_04020 [Trypanosoma rangeli SC58]
MISWAVAQGGGGAVEDTNEETLRECTRIHKLARAVDELVAWSFLMDEKETILRELEGVVGDAERELEKAEQVLTFQRRRCALIPDPTNASYAQQRRRPPPHAAGGEDRGLSALWQEHGGSFTQQYERHLARYRRLWLELLEEPKAAAASPTH